MSTDTGQATGGGSCTGSACGTGGWGGPKPGDPSNNSVLSAVPAFGGIDVSWNLPTTNPFAVAFVILYRGPTSSFDTAIPIKEISNTFYYDPQENQNTWYYWIKLVSINGTYGEVIGPASAAAKPRIQDLIEQLTGKIDSGVLSQALKTEIARIDFLNTGLNKEVTARENANITLGQAIAAAEAGTAHALTFLQNEQINRVNGQDALAASINQLAVTSGSALAAVKTELSTQITIVDGRVTSTAQSVTNLATKTGQDIANVESRLNTSITQVGDRVTALSTRTDQVETAAAGNLSQVKVSLEAKINTTDGKVTSIGALYTAKVNVNGLIGGFGIYNDGTEVEAGFDVDRFWIGRTGANKRKPFIIDGGVVYIDEAAINKLTFSKLRDESGSFIVSNGKVKADYLEIANELRSNNYSSGSAGFLLRRSDGYAEFGNIYARGNIRATSLSADTVTVDNLVTGSLGKELSYLNEAPINVVTYDVWTSIAAASFGSANGRPIHGTAMFAARQTAGRNGAEHRVRVVRYIDGVAKYLYGGEAGAPFTTGYDGSSDCLAFVDQNPVLGTSAQYSIEIKLLFNDDRASFGFRSIFLRELSKANSEIIYSPYTPPSGGGGGGGGGMFP